MKRNHTSALGVMLVVGDDMLIALGSFYGQNILGLRAYFLSKCGVTE